MTVRFKRPENRDAASAMTASARPINGIEYIGSIIPIMPLLIEGWTKRDTTSKPTRIKAIAPRRSSHGARLKNSHQRAIAAPAPSAPIIP